MPYIWNKYPGNNLRSSIYPAHKNAKKTRGISPGSLVAYFQDLFLFGDKPYRNDDFAGDRFAPLDPRIP